MNFVVDASVALAWCFEDEGGTYAIRVLDSLRRSEAIVASHWTLEVTNGLLSAERRGRIEAGDTARFMRMLLILPIVLDPMERSRAFEAIHRLARAHALTSYDAAYLELATRLGVGLATLDEPLARAAGAEGVGVYLRGESE
ncbi:MAG: type II toxin-antitoxin system VapC family toxin [Gemmatimonadetes bacterium]|nr:type II toxin-antitoxin system VapC family toxin [Gemmatimonadota bacterium]